MNDDIVISSIPHNDFPIRQKMHNLQCKDVDAASCTIELPESVHPDSTALYSLSPSPQCSPGIPIITDVVLPPLNAAAKSIHLPLPAKLCSMKHINHHPLQEILKILIRAYMHEAPDDSLTRYLHSGLNL